MDENYFKAILKNEKILPDVLDHFNEELISAKEEVKFNGKNLSKCVCELSANFYKRLMQLQELEAILRHFEIKLGQMKSEINQKVQKTSARALTSSDIKMYIDGQPEIIAMQNVINQIVIVRNKFLALSKAYETANYQLSNLSKIYLNGAQEIIL